MSSETLLHENRVFVPAETFVAQANLSGMASYQTMCDEATRDPLAFWARLARENLHWHQPFTRILDDSNPPFYKWFDDGQTNVAYNCLDRHLQSGLGRKTALIFESDDGEVSRVTYQELHDLVLRCARGLRSLDVGKGDRVVIYMPMSIEGAVAMLACARIGATHSVVFGGFSAKSLHERVVDLGASLIMTADEQKRGGKCLPLKSIVDEALSMGQCEAVKQVVVYRRTGGQVNWMPSRDLWWHDMMVKEEGSSDPEWVEAEHPLFVLYTSGSTGKPKGVQHSTAGYLLWAALTMQWSFDIKPQDVYWCTADIGWITGHTYVVYGPLAVGATALMFEGVPTWPHAGRFWEVIARHRVSVFYTAPTAIRSLIKAAEVQPHSHPGRYDLSSLRLLGTVGEPINPEAWIWYYTQVGGGGVPWWIRSGRRKPEGM